MDAISKPTRVRKSGEATHFVSIEMPIELYDELKALADREDRSVTKQVLRFVRAGLSSHTYTDAAEKTGRSET